MTVVAEGYRDPTLYRHMQAGVWELTVRPSVTLWHPVRESSDLLRLLKTNRRTPARP